MNVKITYVGIGLYQLLITVSVSTNLDALEHGGKLCGLIHKFVINRIVSVLYRVRL
jgi:hypothetical protein